MIGKISMEKTDNNSKFVYLYLIKKEKGDKNNPCKLLKFLDKYINNYGKDCIFLSRPGYIGETKKTIDDFFGFKIGGSNSKVFLKRIGFFSMR